MVIGPFGYAKCKPIWWWFVVVSVVVGVDVDIVYLCVCEQFSLSHDLIKRIVEATCKLHINSSEIFLVKYFAKPFNFLGGADTYTCSFWGHWYHCFEFLVTSPLGFKARMGSALFAFCGDECNVHSPRSTSGDKHANLLAAGTPPVLSPHTVAEVRLLGFKLVLSEYLWLRRSTNWAKPGPTNFQILLINLFYCQNKSFILEILVLAHVCINVGPINSQNIVSKNCS